MRAGRLEPPQAYAHWLLRPACLPIPPRPRVAGPSYAASAHGDRARLYGHVLDVLHSPSPGAADRRARGVIITHPNRDKPVVQATRATVVRAAARQRRAVLIVTIGGWSVLQGALPIQIAYVVVYLVIAFFAARWNRGVLPVAAALAVLLAIFALVAGPGWFARDKTGFAAARAQRRAARACSRC